MSQLPADVHASPSPYEDDSDSRELIAAAAKARELDSTYNFLCKVPFLANTPRKVIQQLAQVALHYTTGRDEVVVQQGAACDDGLFFIKKGSFRVVKELPIYAPESKAVSSFRLPNLSPQGRDAQEQMQTIARMREAERRQTTQMGKSPRKLGETTSSNSIQPSNYSSTSSIHSTHTFLTAEQSRTQALANQSNLRSPPRHHHNYQQQQSSSSLSSPNHNGGVSMLAIHESELENRHSPLTSPSHGAQSISSGGSGGGFSSMHQQSTGSLQDLELYDQQAGLDQSMHEEPTPLSPHKKPVLIGSRFLDLSILGPYATFGEVGVMQRVPRSASVISLAAGGELISITKFDFLRLNTKKTLQAAREASECYRSNEELMYELDDAQQWADYKSQLVDCARARDKKEGGLGGNIPQKISRMPVFESIPVSAFNLRLPMLKPHQLIPRDDGGIKINDKKHGSKTSRSHQNSNRKNVGSTSSRIHTARKQSDGSQSNSLNATKEFEQKQGGFASALSPLSAAAAEANAPFNSNGYNSGVAGGFYSSFSTFSTNTAPRAAAHTRKVSQPQQQQQQQQQPQTPQQEASPRPPSMSLSAIMASGGHLRNASTNSNSSTTSFSSPWKNAIDF